MASYMVPIDWARVWRDRMAAMNASIPPGGRISWEDRTAVEKCCESISSPGYDSNVKLLRSMGLEKSHKFLDIGAGPGTHVIPAAAMVGKVTAIEPSGAMARALGDRLRKNAITNVDIVRKKWEDVDPGDLDGPYDVVLSSLSLLTEDVVPAIEKMCHACSGKVYLVWPAGATGWGSIRKAMRATAGVGQPAPGPKADVLFNVLYAMGICPDVGYYREKYVESYDSPGTATQHYMSRFGQSDPEVRARLLGHIRSVSEKGDRGECTLTGWSTMAVMSWNAVRERSITD